MITMTTKIKAEILNEVVKLDKKIENYFLLIIRGIDVYENNERIEECLKEKSKYHFAI